jgi:hypothetical protein
MHSYLNLKDILCHPNQKTVSVSLDFEKIGKAEANEDDKLAIRQVVFTIYKIHCGSRYQSKKDS